jgi:hypothetical protein
LERVTEKSFFYLFFLIPLAKRKNLRHTSYIPRQIDQKLKLLNLTFSDLYFFCKFADKKKYLHAIYLHVFQKYRIIFSGTNFSRFLDSRLILSISAQSIFAVEPSVWARWTGILTEKIKKKQIFLLGVTENVITQKRIFNIFQI